jgi:predicted ATPase
MKVPNYEPFKYELVIEPTVSGYSISREVLSQNRGRPDPLRHIESAHGDIRYFDIDKKKFRRPSWEHNPLETSLAQVPKMYNAPEALRRILATANQYHVLDVSSRAPVKLPQAMKPAYLPGIDGEDMIPYLYYLRESDPDRFEAIIDTLRAAFPYFDNLGFPPVAAGMLTMTWNDKNFTKPINIHELSEGILRFIWLVSLLYSPHLSTITMIDEPEVSLHPELLSLLVDVMRETSKRTQLVIATHSDRLIRFLRPEEVVVMDINEEGNTNATRADSLDLDAWLKEYSLDEVWRMGRIGGRA